MPLTEKTREIIRVLKARFQRNLLNIQQILPQEFRGVPQTQVLNIIQSAHPHLMPEKFRQMIRRNPEPLRNQPDRQARILKGSVHDAFRLKEARDSVFH